MILHGDEFGPAMQPRGVQCLGKLPGIHGRCTDVPNLARLSHIMKSFERLFYRGATIPAVDLIEIDVIRAKPPQTAVEFREDSATGEASSVRSLPHSTMHLRGKDDIFSFGEIPDGSSDDFF